MNIRRAQVAIATLAAVVALAACGGATTGTQPTAHEATVTVVAAVTTPTPTIVTATTAAPTQPKVTSTSTSTSTSAPEPVVTSPRPQALAELPSVTLLAPGPVADSTAPEFSWAPVDRAVTYRLAVLAPDRPLWSWSGSQTSVTLGLVSADRSPLAAALALEPGSTWSVAALDADGAVIALSPRQHVSPPTTG